MDNFIQEIEDLKASLRKALWMLDNEGIYAPKLEAVLTTEIFEKAYFAEWFYVIGIGDHESHEVPEYALMRLHGFDGYGDALEYKDSVAESRQAMVLEFWNLTPKMQSQISEWYENNWHYKRVFEDKDND